MRLFGQNRVLWEVKKKKITSLFGSVEWFISKLMRNLFVKNEKCWSSTFVSEGVIVLMFVYVWNHQIFEIFGATIFFHPKFPDQAFFPIERLDRRTRNFNLTKLVWKPCPIRKGSNTMQAWFRNLDCLTYLRYKSRNHIIICCSTSFVNNWIN